MYIFDRPYWSLILSLILYTLAIGILYQCCLCSLVTCIPTYVNKRPCFAFTYILDTH